MQIIDSLKFFRIGVATTYGRPYFRFSKALNQLGIRFDSILPDDILQYTGNVILTTLEETPKGCKIPIIHEDVFDQHPTVICGVFVRKLDRNFEPSNLVLGVDPGKRLGLSVSYYGQEIESSIYSSVEQLVSHMIVILGGLRADRKIVKIGNGKMHIARQIGTMLNLQYCSAFELHFVDEKHTSLKIKNHNQRGKRDMLSAKFISKREGFSKHILPLSMTG